MFDYNQKQLLILDKAYYCPYESENRQVLKIGNKRFYDKYICKDYMNEWVVTWICWWLSSFKIEPHLMC